MRYTGPIIDAHHHLWDLAMGCHPWITGTSGAMQSLGDLSFLRRDYLVADYLADIGPRNVTGSVVIEAIWDRARPVEEEARWLAALPRPPGIAARCVAWADLRADDLPGALDRLAETPFVVGVRQTIRWHPDPAKSWAPAGLMDDAAWRRGAALLAARGWLLELLMNPYQAAEVAALARALPGLAIVVNHCCSPLERDAAGLLRWREGLRVMAAAPNVAIKLSNYGAYAVDASPAARRDVVMTLLDAFGPRRAMFGTDYPVGRRAMAYQDICETFADIVADLGEAEQRDLFHDNAARLYRFTPSAA